MLDPVGQQMTDGFTAIITGANKAGIADLLPLAIEGRRLSLMARLDVNKRLGRHDEAAAKSAAQTFETLRHTLAQIDSATKGTDVNAPAAAETKLIDTYQAAFTRAASLDSDQIALVNGAMKQAGDGVGRRTPSRRRTATSPIRPRPRGRRRRSPATAKRWSCGWDSPGWPLVRCLPG